MITKIEARTPQGSLLSLPLEDVFTGILIRDVDGLDPVKATISSSGYATMPGAQFQSSRRETRNILIKLGLEPDFSTDTVDSLRQRVYSFFSPEDEVGLRFYKDSGLTVDISGTVESCESPMFTNDPNASISIICFDPDFVAISAVELEGSTVSDETETEIEYDGTEPAGFTFTLTVDRALSEFTIYNHLPDGSISTLDFEASLEEGDVLTISTVPGSKGVTLLRDGATSSMLYGKSAQSDWLQLVPGTNNIRVYASGDSMDYTLSYTTRYGGL